MKVDDAVVPAVLGLQDSPLAPASEAWLANLPDGPDLEPVHVVGRGEDGPRVAGVRRQIGDLFVYAAQNGRRQNFVLLADGLAPLSATEFALLRYAATAGSPGSAVVRIDAATAASAPRAAAGQITARVPDIIRDAPIGADARHVCLRQQTRGARVLSEIVTVEARATIAAGVRMPTDAGILAASMPAPVASYGKPIRYLITDQGIKYQVQDDASLAALGYSGVVPQPMPQSVLAEIPSGPVLSRQALGVRNDGNG